MRKVIGYRVVVVGQLLPDRPIMRRIAGLASSLYLARSLIRPEILEREERQRRQEELRQERLNQPLPQQPQSPETQVPATPPRQARTLPTRTPTTAERPRLRRSPSPTSSPSPTALPVSTAPPRLGLGRGKRQRHKTARYEAGQAQGFIHESQERLRRQDDSEVV